MQPPNMHTTTGILPLVIKESPGAHVKEQKQKKFGAKVVADHL
jgi:hypothetical protein